MPSSGISNDAAGLTRHFQRSHDAGVRGAVPAGQGIAHQFDSADLPAVELGAGGGTAVVEIALLVFQRHRIGRLLAHRQFESQVLAVEGKAADIDRRGELSRDSAGHLDLAIGIDTQAQRRIARLAALVDHFHLGHPKLFELGLGIGAAQDLGWAIGFRRRLAQACIDPAQTQVDGGLERAGVLAERLDREEGDGDLDLDGQAFAEGKARARRFGGGRRAEGRRQPDHPGDGQIPRHGWDRGPHGAAFSRSTMRS